MSTATDGDTLSVLDDEINSGVEEELTAALDDLAEDQLAEVLAFCWVGQGTYEAERMGRGDRGSRATRTKIVAELMDMPMLASVLEAGHGGVRHQLRRGRRPQLARRGTDSARPGRHGPPS